MLSFIGFFFLAFTGNCLPRFYHRAARWWQPWQRIRWFSPSKRWRRSSTGRNTRRWKRCSTHYKTVPRIPLSAFSNWEFPLMTSEDEEVAIEEKKDYGIGGGGVWGDHWGVDEPTEESEKRILTLHPPMISKKTILALPPLMIVLVCASAYLNLYQLHFWNIDHTSSPLAIRWSLCSWYLVEGHWGIKVMWCAALTKMRHYLQYSH